MEPRRGLLVLTAPALTVARLQGSPTTTAPTTTTRPTTTTTTPGFLDPLSHSFATANSVILVALEWAGILAFVVAVIWLLVLRRRRQLLVPAFTNASGLTELHASVEGLGQLLRERLVDHLQVTQEQLRENTERIRLGSNQETLRDPVPVGAADQRVSQLVTSLKAYVPQTAGPAVQLLSDVFLRPAGTRVTGTVQGDGSARLGITLELTDLGGNHPPILETIWAATAGSATEGGKRTGVQQAEPAEGPGKWLTALRKLAGELAARVRGRGKRAGARQAAPSSGPAERLGALLNPAARLAARRVAALELLYTRRQLRERLLRLLRLLVPPQQPSTGTQQPQWSRQERAALVHNVIGMLLQSDAGSYGEQAPFFFKQAEKEFDRAVETAPHLYQPYENRADTAVLQEQHVTRAPTDPEQGERLLLKAIADYEQALRRAQTLPDPVARTQVVHRLQIGLVLTQRRFNQPARVPVNAQLIPTLEAVAADERDDQFLYNLACWFGLTANQRQQAADAARPPRRRHGPPRQVPLAKPDPAAETKALRYLAYCLARAITDERADDRANEALGDPDLRLIPKEKIRRLRAALAMERGRDPQLRTNEGQPFADAIDRALAQIG
jgi:hypothetical protein